MRAAGRAEPIPWIMVDSDGRRGLALELFPPQRSVPGAPIGPSTPVRR